MTDFDFLSDDFDIDTYLANEEKREEIQQLDQLARDCWMNCNTPRQRSSINGQRNWQRKSTTCR
jgi:hypothetical protein